MRSEYEPYKYVIQDITHVYIGCFFTLQEVMNFEDAPFKVKAAFGKYFFTDAKEGPETTLSDFLFDIKSDQFSYEVLKKLKTKVKYSIPKSFEKDKGYRNEVKSFEEFVASELIKEHKDQIIVEEICFSKLALMGI